MDIEANRSGARGSARTSRVLSGKRCSLALAVLLAAALPAAAASLTDAALAEFRQGRFAEALREWLQAAQGGDARADLYVGVMYDGGLGVPHDPARALAWYRRAAEAGSAAGAFNVGVLYDSGVGVAQDQRRAATWYARAAARGFARAQYNLGLMYEAGIGVARDRRRAAALFTEASRHGITAAGSHLAALGEKPAEAARKPPDLPAAPDTSMQDFDRAQQVLLSRGPAEAGRMAALFRHAAEQHNALAEYDLAYCYQHGMGVPADAAQAVGWYRRAEADAPAGTLRDIAHAGATQSAPP